MWVYNTNTHLLDKHLPHALLLGLHVSEVLLAFDLVRLLERHGPVVSRLVCKTHLLEAALSVELVVLRVGLLTKVLHVGSEQEKGRGGGKVINQG